MQGDFKKKKKRLFWIGLYRCARQGGSYLQEATALQRITLQRLYERPHPPPTNTSHMPPEPVPALSASHAVQKLHACEVTLPFLFKI